MKILKWLGLTSAIVLVSIIAFYLYIGNIFKSSAVEGTINFAKFLAEDKNKNITVYDQDSLRAIFDTTPFKIYVDELDVDTLNIKITW